MTVTAATCYPDAMTLKTRGRLRAWHIAGALLLAGAATACGRSSAPSSPDVWAVVDGREISRTDVVSRSAPETAKARG